MIRPTRSARSLLARRPVASNRRNISLTSRWSRASNDNASCSSRRSDDAVLLRAGVDFVAGVRLVAALFVAALRFATACLAVPLRFAAALLVAVLRFAVARLAAAAFLVAAFVVPLVVGMAGPYPRRNERMRRCGRPRRREDIGDGRRA